MMFKSRPMNTMALTALLTAIILTTNSPGFAALSEAELAATRGMSPGYPPMTNQKTNVAIYNSCATVNRPAGDTTVVVCTNVPDADPNKNPPVAATPCYVCSNTATQQAVDTSNGPNQSTGYVAAQQNQACGGMLYNGTCVNGICTSSKMVKTTCNNPVPAYLQQVAPGQP